MYKNIIFDLGGVMVDFDPKTYLVDRFCNAEVEEQARQAQPAGEADANHRKEHDGGADDDRLGEVIERETGLPSHGETLRKASAGQLLLGMPVSRAAPRLKG